MVESKSLVRIYVCGPTVYDNPHIGNMRPSISFDFFTRALEHLGRPFFYVHNITDIDDKIIARATELGESEIALASRYYKAYLALLRTYHIKRPSALPRVTQNLGAIKRVVKDLAKQGFTYPTAEGVFFATSELASYGEVSGQDRKALQYDQSERGQKVDPADFALWKKTSVGVQYPSPWGVGRPGWHTECVAFIDKYFGENGVSVHGGGIDLIFPHHENENAQFRALYGRPIADSWRHSGQILWNGTKMSKSLGNVVDADGFAKMHGADTLRLLILQSSFAGPLNLGEEQILEVKDLVEKYTQTYRKALLVSAEINTKSVISLEISQELSDFNFAGARSRLQKVVKAFNANREKDQANDVITTMKLLGFAFTRKIISKKERFLYNSWVDLREQQKYDEADRVRKQLVKRKLL